MVSPAGEHQKSLVIKRNVFDINFNAVELSTRFTAKSRQVLMQEKSNSQHRLRPRYAFRTG